MASPQPSQVTQLIQQLDAGDDTAIDRLLPLVYDDLRALARRLHRGGAGQHTLQPTALVHEAYARMLGADGSWRDRQHFMAVATLAMRQLLADYARRKRRQKRGGDREAMDFDPDLIGVEEGDDLDLVELDAALSELAEVDPRQARIVELRFFAGLTVDEAAQIVGIAPRTVRLDWQMAKAWLLRRLRASDD